MKIHTNVLTPDQVDAAADGLPRVWVNAQQVGSRSHRAAYSVNLTGNNITGGQWGNMPAGAKTATWDEWGVVIGRLYVIDPDAVWGSVGNPIYESAEHFYFVTGNRFKALPDVILPADTHKRHRWNFAGIVVTGAYYVNECKTCSAIVRRMAHDSTFAELASL